jgi:hypothetical protein
MGTMIGHTYSTAATMYFEPLSDMRETKALYIVVNISTIHHFTNLNRELCKL